MAGVQRARGHDAEGLPALQTAPGRTRRTRLLLGAQVTFANFFSIIFHINITGQSYTNRPGPILNDRTIAYTTNI